MYNYGQILAANKLFPRSFLEIGSRDGNDAAFFAGLWNPPIQEVYIVEASPTSAEQIRAAHPTFKTFSFAFSNKNGIAKFYNVLGDNPLARGVSSLMDRICGYNPDITKEIEVQIMTGENFFDDNHITQIDACKIDVEGHSYEVLEGFGKDLTKIKSLHMEAEVVPTWVGKKLFPECEALLVKNGYRRFSHVEYNMQYAQCDSIWIHESVL